VHIRLTADGLPFYIKKTGNTFLTNLYTPSMFEVFEGNQRLPMESAKLNQKEWFLHLTRPKES
jgi:hypothetical protein